MLGLIVALVCLAAVTAVLAAAVVQARSLRVTRLNVSLPHWPKGAGSVTIAHLSDLHLPRLPVPPEHIFDAIEDIDPDLIVVSGDTISWNADIEVAVSIIRRLAELGPVLCVSGNIEHMYGLDMSAFGEGVESVGAVLLRDGHWSGAVNGATVSVIGLEHRGAGAPDIDSILAETPPADLTIVLAHAPSVWPCVPRERAHLFLCGHTHGGQLRIPAVGRFLAHSRVEWELKSGVFELPEHGDDWTHLRPVFTHEELCRDNSVRQYCLTPGRPLMCITRGVGSVMLPMRLGSPPEVIGITVSGETAGDASDDAEVSK